MIYPIVFVRDAFFYKNKNQNLHKKETFKWTFQNIFKVVFSFIKHLITYSFYLKWYYIFRYFKNNIHITPQGYTNSNILLNSIFIPETIYKRSFLASFLAMFVSFFHGNIAAFFSLTSITLCIFACLKHIMVDGFVTIGPIFLGFLSGQLSYYLFFLFSSIFKIFSLFQIISIYFERFGIMFIPTMSFYFGYKILYDKGFAMIKDPQEKKNYIRAFNPRSEPIKHFNTFKAFLKPLQFSKKTCLSVPFVLGFLAGILEQPRFFNYLGNIVPSLAPTFLELAVESKNALFFILGYIFISSLVYLLFLYFIYCFRDLYNPLSESRTSNIFKYKKLKFLFSPILDLSIKKNITDFSTMARYFSSFVLCTLGYFYLAYYPIEYTFFGILGLVGKDDLFVSSKFDSYIMRTDWPAQLGRDFFRFEPYFSKFYYLDRGRFGHYPGKENFLGPLVIEHFNYRPMFLTYRAEGDLEFDRDWIKENLPEGLLETPLVMRIEQYKKYYTDNIKELSRIFMIQKKSLKMREFFRIPNSIRALARYSDYYLKMPMDLKRKRYAVRKRNTFLRTKRCSQNKNFKFLFNENALGLGITADTNRRGYLGKKNKKNKNSDIYFSNDARFKVDGGENKKENFVLKKKRAISRFFNWYMFPYYNRVDIEDEEQSNVFEELYNEQDEDDTEDEFLTLAKGEKEIESNVARRFKKGVPFSMLDEINQNNTISSMKYDDYSDLLKRKDKKLVSNGFSLKKIHKIFVNKIKNIFSLKKEEEREKIAIDIAQANAKLKHFFRIQSDPFREENIIYPNDVEIENYKDDAKKNMFHLMIRLSRHKMKKDGIQEIKEEDEILHAARGEFGLFHIFYKFAFDTLSQLFIRFQYKYSYIKKLSPNQELDLHYKKLYYLHFLNSLRKYNYKINGDFESTPLKTILLQNNCKSFSNKFYNHQFKGTLGLIRRFHPITQSKFYKYPSLKKKRKKLTGPSMKTLKFDNLQYSDDMKPQFHTELFQSKKFQTDTRVAYKASYIMKNTLFMVDYTRQKFLFFRYLFSKVKISKLKKLKKNINNIIFYKKRNLSRFKSNGNKKYKRKIIKKNKNKIKITPYLERVETHPFFILNTNINEKTTKNKKFYFLTQKELKDKEKAKILKTKYNLWPLTSGKVEKFYEAFTLKRTNEARKRLIFVHPIVDQFKKFLLWRPVTLQLSCKRVLTEIYAFNFKTWRHDKYLATDLFSAYSAGFNTEFPGSGKSTFLEQPPVAFESTESTPENQMKKGTISEENVVRFFSMKALITRFAPAYLQNNLDYRLHHVPLYRGKWARGFPAITYFYDNRPALGGIFWTLNDFQFKTSIDIRNIFFTIFGNILPPLARFYEKLIYNPEAKTKKENLEADKVVNLKTIFDPFALEFFSHVTKPNILGCIYHGYENSLWPVYIPNKAKKDIIHQKKEVKKIEKKKIKKKLDKKVGHKMKKKSLVKSTKKVKKPVVKSKKTIKKKKK
uniref:Conserved chloroplast protein Ycf1 n=1 Tax=Prototheca stagnorum TaxID=215448 RepID=A0A2Z6BEP0_9CHLO|nr:conserved chloroplast protein Ycf1 [Prototheca stagnorum]BBD20194.1 conserved chloroplast protein Ycf1 [Prototheca stagnorum]